ncbi:MAG: LysR family transcriptional regulator [Lachnospiraceae bacterium]|nr:LysR family transcriptional regulator [Lachnospiraceae bacterium]
MEIMQCEAVLKAAELGSLSAAGEALNYTQSGITRMIKSLEEELGYPVFNRSKRGVVLTENGKAMIPMFQDIVRAHNNAIEFSSGITGLITGTLKIGTYYSISALCLPSVLRSFCNDYPGITIDLTEGGNKEVRSWLNDCTMDCCFCAEPASDLDFSWIPLFEDEVVAWLPPDHPKASLDRFSVDDFNTEPFIHTSPDHDTDQDRLLAKFSLHPDTRFSTRDGYSTYKMVAAGLGVSFNQRLISRDWPKEIAEVPLDPPQFISLGIAYPSETSLSPAARIFTAYAAKEIRRIQLGNN